MYMWYSMTQSPLSVWLFFVGVDVREGGQGESGGSGEVREANRKTMQPRHTVYATPDQLSLQLCLHSGLINMTTAAGSQTHPHTHTWTLTSRCNNLWPHLHTFLLQTCQPSAQHLLPRPLYMRIGIKLWSLITHHHNDQKYCNTHTHTHACRYTEKLRTNESEINQPLIFREKK